MAKKQAWHCHSFIWPFKWSRECWNATRIPRWIISRWGVQVSELAANSQTAENHGPSAITMYNQPTEISDAQLCKLVRSLNKMQHKTYNRVLSWTRNKKKNLKSLKSQNVEPVYLFMTGGGGSRKIDLIKIICHTVVKSYRHAPTNPEKPTALLAASTGVAAISIDGTTINTALAIPKHRHVKRAWAILNASV